MPVHEIADDDASRRLKDRRRGEFQYDEFGNVTTARIPMMLRDAAMRDADRREVQRQIKADRQRVVDGAGNDGLALHRPGSRFAADAGLYDAAAKAYSEMVTRSENAWRDGPGGGQQDASSLGTEYGGKPGDPCTVRSGAGRGWIEGGPGHLACVNVEGEDVLICVPNAPSDRRSDNAPILDWRTTDLAKLVRDAAAIKQQAYDEMCQAAEQAWKNLGRS